MKIETRCTILATIHKVKIKLDHCTCIETISILCMFSQVTKQFNINDSLGTPTKDGWDILWFSSPPSFSCKPSSNLDIWLFLWSTTPQQDHWPLLKEHLIAWAFLSQSKNPMHHHQQEDDIVGFDIYIFYPNQGVWQPFYHLLLEWGPRSLKFVL